MKILFLIVIISLFSDTYAQEVDWILKDNMEWNKHPDQVSQQTKKHIVDSILTNSYFNEIGMNFFNDSSFHFLDINNDSKSDIIYYGFAGTESNRTIIFLNQDGIFKQIADYFGRTFDLEFKEGALKYLYIKNYSCCGGYITHFEKYEFNIISNQFELKDKIAYCTGTYLPKTKTFRQRFITINDSYRLRTDPVIDNKEYNSNSRPFDALGNILAEFPRGSEGIAIADSTDETGRLWWFVIMDENCVPENSIFYHGDNNELPYKTTGWMSSRYVEKK